MNPLILNLRRLGGDVSEAALARRGIVRIDRATRWGNPYRLKPTESRGATIERYRRHLWRRIKSGDLPLEDLAQLHNRSVACHCSPSPCHGEVLLRAAAWAAGQLAARCDDEAPAQ